MIPVYANPSELEALAKEKYAIPEFLMMENAAKSIADFILKKALLSFSSSKDADSMASVVIVCGKGNNGGDGYALARLLQDKLSITVLSIKTPTAEEAKVQYEMCLRLGIQILSAEKPADFEAFESKCKKADYIVDCIYGTGFHGELDNDAAAIINLMNKSKGIKIACDIPSGLAFNADFTLTMGEHKLALFSDRAKDVCGEIIVNEIGISQEKFEEAENTACEPAAFLLQHKDITLPLRKNKAAHKGKYGHTAVLCGDKAGAAILSASAAMNFGSGLTSLVKTADSNLEQFKISPSLMISDKLPSKTTCIALGSGFTDFSETAAQILINWFQNTSSPAAVLDAGMLTSPKTPELLLHLNSFKNARIILTPHLAELSRLLENSKAEGDISVAALADNPEIKIKAGSFLNKLFPCTTIIMKSANTFIASEKKVYIVADGSPSLAKGGSGDILAGLSAALLAQGYSAKDAAITAAEYHALLSRTIGKQNFNLTPEKLLEKI